jgi:hypothetical protein
METPRGEDGMTRNLIVIGCAALLTFGLSFGSFAGSSPDSDSDGVPDAFDNCTTIANGPLLASPAPLCNAQQDADSDGYGQPCDADVNNDGGVGLDDVNALLSTLNTVDAVNDLNCDGGVGLDDINTGLQALNTAPGPSGLACAGTGSTCTAQ